jgi:segregation and condensation protein A
LADYRVNLDIFAGPLDLLLYLVRKEEVDIYDIPIAKITDQYIRYVEMLKRFDVDLAGDFLVMAATLMEIKSAMLLPTAEPDSELSAQDQQLTDPRAELIRQLLEYKKFKDAANLLNAVADRHSERFPRPDSIIDQLRPDAEPELDIDQVSIWDLVEAFDSICKATGLTSDVSRIKDDTPIDLYQIEILHRLQAEGPMTFVRIFEPKSNRAVMVGLFLALLELIRERLVWAEQSASTSDIFLRPMTDEPAAAAVQKAIRATEESNNEKPIKDRKSQQRFTETSKSTQETKPVLSANNKDKIPIPISEFSPKQDSDASRSDKKVEHIKPANELK